MNLDEHQQIIRLLLLQAQDSHGIPYEKLRELGPKLPIPENDLLRYGGGPNHFEGKVKIQLVSYEDLNRKVVLGARSITFGQATTMVASPGESDLYEGSAIQRYQFISNYLKAFTPNISLTPSTRDFGGVLEEREHVAHAFCRNLDSLLGMQCSSPGRDDFFGHGTELSQLMNDLCPSLLDEGSGMLADEDMVYDFLHCEIRAKIFSLFSYGSTIWNQWPGYANGMERIPDAQERARVGNLQVLAGLKAFGFPLSEEDNKLLVNPANAEWIRGFADVKIVLPENEMEDLAEGLEFLYSQQNSINRLFQFGQNSEEFLHRLSTEVIPAAYGRALESQGDCTGLSRFGFDRSPIFERMFAHLVCCEIDDHQYGRHFKKAGAWVELSRRLDPNLLGRLAVLAIENNHPTALRGLLGMSADKEPLTLDDQRDVDRRSILRAYKISGKNLLDHAVSLKNDGLIESDSADELIVLLKKGFIPKAGGGESIQQVQGLKKDRRS